MDLPPNSWNAHLGPPQQRYDLKGNTDRRQAIPTAQVEGKMHAAIMREPIDKLMMDIDFTRIHQCILLADADATTVKLQLKNDIQFLAEHHIMDYSTSRKSVVPVYKQHTAQWPHRFRGTLLMRFERKLTFESQGGGGAVALSHRPSGYPQFYPEVRLRWMNS
ncbi:hypothetical protein DYB30_000817 [Aphanomyces astaci]|uniref:PIPK domain-containing protein n=3 Tax=Aphanomyces astaci TaxID=112090 RepID=A0A397D039_APHAT|nr:hypothetical protein DYB30_000817 [Aphanomyces astaci]RHZ16190.1 hypothetical protein DYB31_001741 [Aphanomyces astaci]